MGPELLSLLSLGGFGIQKQKEYYDQFGFIIDDVLVTVYGTPFSRKAELYKLAASLAFSMAQRLDLNIDNFHPAPGSVTVQYDAAQNYVTINVKYSTSLAVAIGKKTVSSGLGLMPLIGGLVAGPTGALIGGVADAAIEAVADGPIGAAALSGSLPVLSGPKDEHVGAQWNFTGPGIGAPFGAAGVLGAVPGAGVPGLVTPDLSRWVDHTILTNRTETTPPEAGDAGKRDAGPKQPTLNPRPVVDHRSRGSFTSLVFSALSTPGTDYDLLYPKVPGNLSDYNGS